MNSKQSITMLCISTIVFVLFVGGCSWVTTYGHEPVRPGLSENIYEFSIYYNYYATLKDCDDKAKEEADIFMNKHNYDQYTIHDRRNVLRPWSKYVYRIEFFRLNKE